MKKFITKISSDYKHLTNIEYKYKHCLNILFLFVSIDHETSGGFLSYCSSCRCYCQRKKKKVAFFFFKRRKKQNHALDTTYNVKSGITITSDFVLILKVSVDELRANPSKIKKKHIDIFHRIFFKR